jgi:3-oxoacyl-[acyl-carrier-protein] synthase-3
MTVAEIDFIIFATMTPDVTFPGAGCYFQNEIGCETTPALDIRAQCAGFLYSLSIAEQFVLTKAYRRIVIAAAEIHSSGLDYSDAGAEVARLFGDGAGVALVGVGEGSAGVRAVTLHSDGRRHRDFWVEYPASRQHPVRVTVDNLRQRRHFPTLAPDIVHEFALSEIPAVVGETLAKCGLALDRVDRWILSHVFPETAFAVADKMKVPADRVDVPSSRHGHISAGALPIALSEAADAGHVGPGAVVGLAACGAGFTWGAAVVEL